jgi:hypothetical protein
MVPAAKNSGKYRHDHQRPANHSSGSSAAALRSVPCTIWWLLVVFGLISLAFQRSDRLF